MAKKRAYAASRAFDGKVGLFTFSQAERVDTATGSSSDSALATSLCLRRTSENCEDRSSRRRRASEAAVVGTVTPGVGSPMSFPLNPNPSSVKEQG